MRRNFNPRSPRGGATIFIASLCHIFANFNPRSPRGGATCRFSFNNAFGKFQSTLPTRGSDSIVFLLRNFLVYISIHAPHEGERRAPFCPCRSCTYFNPRSPRGGATAPRPLLNVKKVQFQSTLPTRGSDFGACLREGGINQYFNPRSPRGGATRFIRYIWSNIIISIHAPHEGERPIVDLGNNYATTISIHAPHEGERLINGFRSRAERPFQSTLPTRGSDRYIIQSISS